MPLAHTRSAVRAGSRPTSRRSSRLTALAATVALLAPLAACAQKPAANWQPPAAAPVPGVAFASLAGGPESAPEPPAGSDTAGGDTAGEVAGRDPEAQTALFDTAALGLVGGRLRNDALPLAARFVYVPGVPEFNAHMNAWLWSAIEATGVGYAPQVHGVEAGLGDRGCVPGSVSWPAADVLTRPETGPVGGAGTAVTCEVTAAHGTVLTVALRTVTGSADAVTGDTVQRLMIDVTQGTVADLGERWNAEAAPALWTRAIELLRQRAGGLSSAPIAAPDDAQLALARQALDQAVLVGAGALVTLPAGVSSPELVGLGAGATSEPLELTVDAATTRAWSSAAQLALLDGMAGGGGDAGAAGAAPFGGVTAAATTVPIDCALIPCVALTYDDGPTGYTPELLDTLWALQASATFYMVGGHAQGNPDIVARAANEGHELGSHTFNHRDLTTLSLADARTQVVSAADVLRQISGQPVATFRPPYGAINQAVIDAVGMPAVLWSVDTNDWRRPGVDALFDRAVNGAAPGGIVLFHDTHDETVAAAGDIIVGLRNRGFEPVTVTELFGGAVPQGRVSAR